MQALGLFEKAKRFFAEKFRRQRSHYKTSDSDVIEDERALLQGQGRDLSHLRGLALSGGGIRSASFACGVMEALARQNKLNGFHYLSSVSGGGYTASALTWALKTWPGAQPNDFPHFPTGPGLPRYNLLERIRGRANYLAPTTEVTLLVALTNMMRLSMTSLIIYLTMLVLIATGLVGAFYSFSCYVCDAVGHDAGTLGALTKAAVETTRQSLPSSPLSEALKQASTQTLAMAQLPQAIGYSIIDKAFQLVGSVIIWIGNRILIPESHTCFVAVALIIIAIALSILLGLVLFYLLMHVWPSFENTHKRRYRTLMVFSKVTFGCLMVMMLFALPVLHSILLAKFGTSAASLLGPALAGAVGGLSRAGAVIKMLNDRTRTLLMRLASALLFLGFMWLVYAIAFHSLHIALDKFGIDRIPLAAIALYVLVGALCLIISLNLNPNYISPHRYYRDRLMEAFLPGSQPDDYSGPDSTPLYEMCNATSPRTAYPGPYHLINSNVILVRSQSPKNYQRMGDSFILSPRYCGSQSTGWIETTRFGVGGIFSSPLSLPTAMAISGAAANPNTSGGGDALTRRWTVSFLMTLLNIRLGYWQPNPRTSEHSDKTPEPSFARPGLVSLFSNYYDETQRYIELSDGGHFDNTGLYELFRRKVRLIVLSDASCDSDYSLDDLGRALALAQIDFGITIDFDGLLIPDSEQLWDKLEAKPDQPRPYRGKGYPTAVDAMRAKVIQDGFVTGRILYADGMEAVLVYLKPSLIQSAPADVVSYGINNPDFPHETTANQFFSERQFEAYRRLGFEIATAASVHF